MSLLLCFSISLVYIGHWCLEAICVIAAWHWCLPLGIHCLVCVRVCAKHNLDEM